MMFPDFLMARIIAQRVSDFETDDLIRQWEQHSLGLEEQLESLTAQYRELEKNAGVLVDYIKTIEKERNQLFEKSNNLQKENEKLSKILADFPGQ